MPKRQASTSPHGAGLRTPPNLRMGTTSSSVSIHTETSASSQAPMSSQTPPRLQASPGSQYQESSLPTTSLPSLTPRPQCLQKQQQSASRFGASQISEIEPEPEHRSSIIPIIPPQITLSYQPNSPNPQPKLKTTEANIPQSTPTQRKTRDINPDSATQATEPPQAPQISPRPENTPPPSPPAPTPAPAKLYPLFCQRCNYFAQAFPTWKERDRHIVCFRCLRCGDGFSCFPRGGPSGRRRRWEWIKAPVVEEGEGEVEDEGSDGGDGIVVEGAEIPDGSLFGGSYVDEEEETALGNSGG